MDRTSATPRLQSPARKPRTCGITEAGPTSQAGPCPARRQIRASGTCSLRASALIEAAVRRGASILVLRWRRTAATAGSRAAPIALYEGWPAVKSHVRFLTSHRYSPGERCRVKRPSKVTLGDHRGSWRLTRQREPGRTWSRAASGSVGWSGAHLSIASSTSKTRCNRGSLRWRNSKVDCQAVRAITAPAGAKGLNGWLRVSMYQIASLSFRARSICATFAPRWRPRRRLVRW
jgi:hypothetical protein